MSKTEIILAITCIISLIITIIEYKKEKNIEHTCNYNDNSKCYEKCCYFCKKKKECEWCCGADYKKCQGYGIRVKEDSYD